jgi:hypothetical protein
VVYKNGAFVPTDHCIVPEGSEGSVVLDSPALEPPAVADPEERKLIREARAEEMRRNPLPLSSPGFTHEALR